MVGGQLGEYIYQYIIASFQQKPVADMLVSVFATYYKLNVSTRQQPCKCRCHGATFGRVIKRGLSCSY